MPQDQYDGDFRITCTYCRKVFPKSQLSKCGRCRMVRYCSKECQKNSWPFHRAGCSSKPVMQMAEDPRMKTYFTALAKWIDRWRSTLIKWAVWAIDTCELSVDALGKYWLVVELENRPTIHKQWNFKLKRSEIADDRRLIELMLATGARKETVNGWQSKRAAAVEGGVQVMVQYGQNFKAMVSGLHTLEHEAERRRPYAAALKHNWQAKLMDVIDSEDEARSEYYEEAAMVEVFGADEE